MYGLITAAGLSTRLQDLADKRNKVLLDLGGETLLSNILNHFETVGIRDTRVLVGFDGPTVRLACGTRAQCLLNPFFEHYGILGSLWLARTVVEGSPFLFTTGDHYFGLARLQSLLQDQPEADILVDDTGVSRKHLEVRTQNGTTWAVDLGSTNGSYVNGHKVDGSVELTDGSTITMGRTKIIFRLLPQNPGGNA